MAQSIDPNAGEPRLPNQLPPRVHQTHKTKVIRLLLKGLTLGQRLRKNTEIEENNEAQAQAHLEPAMDPDAKPEAILDNMSLITIKSHEWHVLKKKQLRKSWTGLPKERTMVSKHLGKEDDMMFGDYAVAHPNFFRMITEIDPQGLLGIQSKFYKNHFTFFNQQIDKHALKCKECINYHISLTSFEPSYYSEYKHFKLAHHIREETAKQLAEQLAKANKHVQEADSARKQAESCQQG
ncbi:hypothetical protein IW261DRAFT_1427507 [Armillaria novae-zelandiae]|uniref:Uncharacterized protein n=1 Tax=Armillaria novae-zelandiae TaxID=153914 RepID=A0AA39TMB3_9AGAR|nr:hypothetical protein IW261DRAFT_1427507 [Armillaria novae-zelandiae]